MMKQLSLFDVIEDPARPSFVPVSMMQRLSEATGLSEAETKRRIENIRTSPRGFLANYPDDVVYVVNGRPVTKGDILDGKRKKQARQLERKRRQTEAAVKPCFVWTFYNGSTAFGAWPIYGGWWLYVRTLHQSWRMTSHSIANREQLVVKIRQMFPCGLLSTDDFDEWCAAFAETYRYPTRKRPNNQGLAIAWATVSTAGHLLDVRMERP